MVEELRRRHLFAQRPDRARCGEASLSVAVVQGDAHERLDQQRWRPLCDQAEHSGRGRAHMRRAVAQAVVDQHQIGRGVAPLAATQAA